MVNHNGKLVSADAPMIEIDNRSFRYGDGLFESMRVVDGQIVLLSRHIRRLQTGMDVLKIKRSPDMDQGFWKQEILSLCEENSCLECGRIRLTIYRNAGGYYSPTNSDFGFLIEAEGNDTIFSNDDDSGLNLGVYKEILKPINRLGGIKTANSLIYVMAGLAKEDLNVDDMIILNEKGRVAEAISSNLFIVKNGEVFTPALDEGCVAGVTRDWLLEQVRSAGMKTQECQVTLEDVQGADEIFLSNAIQGIRKVLSFGASNYSDEVIKELCAFKPESVQA